MAEQAFEVEVALPHSVISTVRAPVERLQQSEGELSYGFGGVRRYVGNEEAQAFGGFEVDIIVARAAKKDCANASVVQPLQHRGREDIVDKDAHGVVTVGEGHRLAR